MLGIPTSQESYRQVDKFDTMSQEKRVERNLKLELTLKIFII